MYFAHCVGNAYSHPKGSTLTSSLRLSWYLVTHLAKGDKVQMLQTQSKAMGLDAEMLGMVREEGA